jgi:hypothetical protein
MRGACDGRAGVFTMRAWPAAPLEIRSRRLASPLIESPAPRASLSHCS